MDTNPHGSYVLFSSQTLVGPRVRIVDPQMVQSGYFQILFMTHRSVFWYHISGRHEYLNVIDVDFKASSNLVNS